MELQEEKLKLERAKLFLNALANPTVTTLLNEEEIMAMAAYVVDFIRNSKLIDLNSMVYSDEMNSIIKTVTKQKRGY